MAFTEKQLKVLCNIIGAVETGGQVYGQGRYDDFTEAYTNSSAEKSITIGKYQHYGIEAKELLQRIQTADPILFKKLDTSNIASDLKTKNWNAYRLKKNSAKAKCIQKIISSDVGKKIQDQMVGEQMQKFADEALALGVTDSQAQAECCNFRHQGGILAIKRILGKTKKPYTLDSLYAACQTDTGNQVGAYKTRQKKVYEWLKKYWVDEDSSSKEQPKEEPKEEKKKDAYPKVGEVSANLLNFRTHPTTDSANLKSYPTLKKDTRIIIEKEIINSKKEKWYYIAYNGKHGYVMAKWINIIA